MLKKMMIAAAMGTALMLTALPGMADVAAGKATYAAKGCIGCHGAGGMSAVPANPTLKGKDTAFVQENLTKFRSGERSSSIMNAMAAGLSDADIANLADYIGSL